ncbi:MAG: class I SAM-dependent rRNA methyltransferase [Anaerolineae bacterium]|nr:class I SAM-dependent rRNA methyltransferase [Anaerolineae bacterium]
MASAIVRLKPGREKSVRRRHPWIFSGAIAEVEGAPSPGDVVEVHSAQGEFLARGYYNPRSQITVRVLTWDEQERIDATFWQKRLERALARRETLAQSGDTTAYRLVFAESDGLPGLIVDRYGDWLVLQSLALGIEPWKELLAELLLSLTEAKGVYERSDVDVRTHEGLPPRVGLLKGELPPEELVVYENGLAFYVDLFAGQKTGLYLDQRENRAKVALYCRDAEVLDVFSYVGGFALYAAREGARRIVEVDSSREALRAAERNMELNGFSPRDDEYLEGDAFRILRTLRDQARQFDVVILDPPKFAFSRAQVQSATRGYKDINMLGMRLVRPGGVLCTFSCSGLVSMDLFQKVLFGASVDVGREVRVLEYLHQARDHPLLLSFPEGAYLKGFICRVE